MSMNHNKNGPVDESVVQVPEYVPGYHPSHLSLLLSIIEAVFCLDLT